MLTCRFEGIDRLVSGLDAAVQREGISQITESVKDTLATLISQRGFTLPEEFLAPRPDSYARRLVYRSEELSYEVIAMTWGPGQGTPLHDHAGIWCVEGVYQGEIEVCQYDLLEKTDDRYLFQPSETVHAHLGMSGSLIPPYEYHTIANHLSDRPSVTVHVYGGGMDHCHVFDPVGGGWFEKVRKQLAYHN